MPRRMLAARAASRFYHLRFSKEERLEQSPRVLWDHSKVVELISMTPYVKLQVVIEAGR